MNWINLDQLAAQTAHQIIEVIDDKQVKASAVDTFATKALGVLQEQGAYAGILFLLSRSGNETEKSKQESEEAIACQIAAELLKLLNHENLKSLNLKINDGGWATNPGQVNTDRNKKDILDHFADKVSADIHKLLSIKSLFEQVLTYTRYSAKALSKSEEKSESQSAGGGTS